MLKGWHFPGKLQPIADRIQPRDITVLHGAVDVKKLNLIQRLWDTVTYAVLEDEWHPDIT